MQISLNAISFISFHAKSKLENADKYNMKHHFIFPNHFIIRNVPNISNGYIARSHSYN